MKNNRKNLVYLLVAAFLLLTLSLNIDRVIFAFSAIIEATKPIAFGILIAIALDSPVQLFQRIIFKDNKSKKRTVAVIITVFVVLAVIIGASYIIIPNVSRSLNTVISRVPYYAVKINEKINEIALKLGITILENESLLGNANQLIYSLQGYASAVAITLVDIVKSIVNFVLAFVFSVYLLISKENIGNTLFRMKNAFTTRPIYDKIYQYSIEFAHTFKRFVNGQVLEGAIIGTLCFIGMLIIRLPYAGLISVLIAITSLVPVFGAYIGAVPAVLLLLLENPVQALVFVIFIVALQQFEGSVIYPKVVGDAIGLDGLFVFAGVTLGAGFGGLVGVIIGVPLIAVVVYALKNALVQKENERGKEK